jgi:arylsulfatase A-like enzyme
MQLGKRGNVDFLGVSFSALDLVGHAFGPNSHEVQDLLARLDLTIGELLNHLDASVGAENYVLGFSADHGVGDIPEDVKGGRYTSAITAGAVEKALEPLLGAGKHVAYSAYTDIYLAGQALRRIRKTPRPGRRCSMRCARFPASSRPIPADEIAQARNANVVGSGQARRGAQLSRGPQRRSDHRPARELAAHAERRIAWHPCIRTINTSR